MKMNSSINLTSQRISFVNKISILQKALSNDEIPTPSYLYKEINDISYESAGYCESLVEFIIDRLRHQSCHVKLKVLKVIKHVLENGSKEVKLGLRQHVAFVKECTKFSGPPHPTHGNLPYVMVRNMAVDLCERLYNINLLSLESAGKGTDDIQAPPSKYGGMGPSRSGGAIQGFGNSPMSQSKGFAGTILHEIEKLGTKLSETPADRQAAVLAKLNLSGSSSNYQPPVISPDASETSTNESKEESPDLSVDQTIERPVFQHGKAGGGWNDDDDDDDVLGNDKCDETEYGIDDDDDDRRSAQESQSSKDSDEKEGSEELDSKEKSLVENMTTQNLMSSGLKIQYMSNNDVANFLLRCSKLRCAIVLDCICDKLTEGDPIILSRSLQLLEGIVYSHRELINIDVLALRCKSALMDCFANAGKEASDVESSTSSGDLGKWKSVQTKAAKLILILQQLSSQKEIFTNMHISCELSTTPSLSTSSST